MTIGTKTPLKTKTPRDRMAAIRKLAAQAQEAQREIDRIEEGAGWAAEDGDAERIAYLKLIGAQDELVAEIAEAEAAGLMRWVDGLLALAEPAAGAC